MEVVLDFLLTAFCISIPIGILVLAAIFGTRSRLRYADRIRTAQARGAFEDMNAPENKSRFRRLAIFALIGVLGMVLFLVILILQLGSQYADYYRITLGLALLFGAMGSIAGFLMQREVDRRL
jgi:hypothetical protein